MSHRVRVEVDDLNQSLNQGATYFAEAQYVTPHEYTWCQAHPGECNMYNNVSYRQFSVSGTTSFTFSPVGSTVRMQPAIMAWTGATMNQIEPDPGNDGIWFMGYKVTNPVAGVWHYEYALYNENLDRAIQSFSVPFGPGVNISNIGFHAPPQEPGWANDGTFNNQGYSSTPWTVTQAANSITWNSETFAQNQNANAIRWGTLYNFRFDADQPPQNANATVGFFKTGSPTTVAIQAPAGAARQLRHLRYRDGNPTPTATATATRNSDGNSTQRLAQHRLRHRGLRQHQGLVRHRDLAPLLCLVRSWRQARGGTRHSIAGCTRDAWQRPVISAPLAIRIHIGVSEKPIHLRLFVAPQDFRKNLLYFCRRA